MPSRPVAAGLQELEEYLENYRFDRVKNRVKRKNFHKSFYKRYHALLILLSDIKSRKPSNFKDHAQYLKFLTYFKECVSDVCQANFLWNQGLYKPSYLVLRSGIENFFKCIGIYESQEILDLKSVFEIIHVIQETKIIKKNDQTHKAFQNLHRIYINLCLYVHTSTIQHMSLTIAVGVFPRFKASEAEQGMKIIRDTTKWCCSLLCFMFPDQYRTMHYKSLDIIADILPPATKRKLTVK